MLEGIVLNAAVAYGGPILMLAITWAAGEIVFYARKASKKIGLDLEETHLARLEAGIINVAKKGLADGKLSIGEIATLAIQEMNEAKPQAMEAVKPTRLGVENIVTAVAIDMKNGIDTAAGSLEDALNKQLSRLR